MLNLKKQIMMNLNENKNKELDQQLGDKVEQFGAKFIHDSSMAHEIMVGFQ